MEVILEVKRSYFRVFITSRGSYFREKSRLGGSYIRGIKTNKVEVILESVEVILEGKNIFQI